MLDETFYTWSGDLKKVIENTYEAGTSLDEAEKLGARFLAAQMHVAELLRKIDLDARMRRTGVKSIKAAVYHEEATRGDKKPSDAFLQSLVDKNEIVVKEQDGMDEAEVDRDYLQNCFDIFGNAHIYYRGIAKGRFE